GLAITMRNIEFLAKQCALDVTTMHWDRKLLFEIITMAKVMISHQIFDLRKLSNSRQRSNSPDMATRNNGREFEPGIEKIAHNKYAAHLSHPGLQQYFI